ncbi:DUF971 domain-containing protein [Candidatus Sumerlaeota bacterium]|nr:DUF971 domain-containing protein [Candidatus Sumerlaeota bacterium]
MPTIKKPLLVRSIEQIDAHTFGIEWTDGCRCRWRISHLRRNCPCANCVDEWTGRTLLDKNKVDDNLMALGIESVGRYALTVKFADGHNTGIFTFRYLRELCQNPGCTHPKRPPEELR